MSNYTDSNGNSDLPVGKLASSSWELVCTQHSLRNVFVLEQQEVRLQNPVQAVACPSLRALQACLHAMLARQCSLLCMYALGSMNGTASTLCHLGLSLCNMRLDPQQPHHSSAQAEDVCEKGLHTNGTLS